MSNQISIFENSSFGSVRVIMRGSAPWFVAADVCKCLGYQRTSDTISAHCKKVELLHYGDLPQCENSGFSIPPAGLNVIPESDLYRLIMRSHLPNAEAFQDWVVEEVLPTIRKTGRFVIEKAKESKDFNLSDRITAADIILSKYYTGNQLVLALDKVHYNLTGDSVLQITDTQLIAPQQQPLYTPTEIGKAIDPICSAAKVNKYLESMGWQTRVNKTWEATGDGVKFAIYLDTGKQRSTGVPIRQLKWVADTIFAVQAHINNM